MAGLRSTYELKKWTAIRNVTAVPLNKVLEGIYNPSDIMSIGQALEQYDELAHSVFAAGLRAVEQAAHQRVDNIQEHRTLVKKPPLSARQLSIIYGQALDRAQKETMPELIATIKDILNLRTMESQPGATGPHLATERDRQPQVPKIKPVGGLARFMPEPAANDEAPKDREQVFERLDEIVEGQGDQTDMLELLQGLVEGLKEGATEELAKYKKDIEDIRALVDEDAKRAKQEHDETREIRELLHEVKDSSVQTNTESRALEFSYRNSSGALRVVTAATSEGLRRAFVKQQQEDKASAKAVATVASERQERKARKGLISAIGLDLDKRDRHKRAKELKKQRTASLVASGAQKEKGMARATRLVKNTKDEFGGLKNYLVRKYGTVRTVGSKSVGILKTVALLGGLAVALSAAWDGFTSKFDFGKFVQEAVVDTASSIWEKIKSLVGLDDKSMAARGIKSGMDSQQARTSSGKITPMSNDVVAGRKAIQKDLNDGLRRFTPEEAAKIERDYNVKIPKDRISATSSGTRTPNPGVGASSVSAPGVKGGNLGGSTSAAPGGPDATGAGSPGYGPSSSSSISAAPAKQRSSVSAAPRADAAAAPGSARAVSGAPQMSSSPRTAQPPKVQESTQQAPQASTRGATAGSSPVNLSAVPDGSYNHDTSFALNIKAI